MRRRALALLVGLLATHAGPTLYAQGAGAPDSSQQQGAVLRAFLDCHAHGCDDEFFVTEIPFVNFIRDRADSDVHLLVTSLETGSGGTQYTVTFIGLRRFAGRADTLASSVAPNSSDDARRRELTRLFKLGLVRYVANTSAAARLKITFDGLAAGSGKAAPARDPWNYWVFRIGGNGSVGGESQSKRRNFSSNISARRTTAEWKLSLGGNGSYRESQYDFADGTSSTYLLRSYSLNGRAVKSLDGHWSAGVNVDVGQSDFSNQKFYSSGTASAEYNFYPWSKATEKQFVAIYAAGFRHYAYQKETIYFLNNETRPQHQFVLAGTTKQPWGSFDVQLRASQYLHDGSKQNLSVSGFTDVRLTRGLSLNVFAFASRVRDQLFIAAGTLSRDDILTQQRALATSYSFNASIGLSYTFGSIFNSVVNPRLDNLNGGQSFFFFF